VAAWYWPGKHAVQPDELVETAYWPATHSTQFDAPATAATLPAAQPTHTLAVEVEE
jgi:hypothetical protein